jgi:hypothetical protein
MPQAIIISQEQQTNSHITNLVVPYSLATYILNRQSLLVDTMKNSGLTVH